MLTEETTNNSFGVFGFVDATYGGVGTGVTFHDVNYLDIGLFLKYPFELPYDIDTFPILGFNMQKALEDSQTPLDRLTVNAGVGLDWNFTDNFDLRGGSAPEPCTLNIDFSFVPGNVSVKLAVGWKFVGGNVPERNSLGYD